jgi:amino acid transporter
MKNALWTVVTVVWVIVALLACAPAMMSFMMFDAPGSTSSVPTIVAFASTLTLPLFFLAGAIVPWCFRKKRIGKWLFLIPFVDVVAVIATFVFLAVFCGGNFTCR